MPLLLAAQFVIQGVNFTDLSPDLLRIVRRNASGQLADQVLNGTDRTDKRTRRAGISRGIAAGSVVFMQAGQRLCDTSAVLCTHMRTQSRFVRSGNIVRSRIARGRMLMNAVRFRCIAAVAVAMSTFLFQYRRNIPALTGVRRMMRAQPAVRSHTGGKSLHRKQVQAQRQSDDETLYSAFHAITSQAHEGTASRAQIPQFNPLDFTTGKANCPLLKQEFS